MTKQPQSKPTTINFAFPFRAKDGKEIVDEHIVHEWLLGESHGPFAVTGSGMWHGGIHVSAANTGRHLDLEHGVRCIADGDIVAYRANFAPKESEIDAANRKLAAIGHYSSAFTLVRHVLEFPAANKLTFFSLYMHLRSASEYANRNKEAPPYWSRCYVVSDHAIDKPRGAGNHSPIPIDHTGLNIHATAHGIATNVLGILPRGTKIRIGTTSSDGKWGQISAIEEGRIVAPEVNGYVRPDAKTGWVFLGKEKHHQLLVPDVSQAQCDQIICPSRPIRINAGELIGHLGQYWLPDSPQTSNLMTHLEVFCGEELESFLKVSQDASKDLDVKQCPLLHIGKGVKLFQNKRSVNGKDVYEEGANAPETGVFQVYSQAVLDALPAENKGPKDDLNGGQEPWWKITSANSRLEDITGWVRNRQMPHNGNVTRESPHAWCDFAPITGADAGNPTVFQSVDNWLDHMLCEDKPATGDVGKLKQVACNFYRTLSPTRNEARAADELRSVSQKKWLAFRASRLIPKHKSEWAKDGSFDNFFEKVKARLESDPYHDAEIARAHELMWWDEVRKNITGTFPSSPTVFHIHPIAVVANFPLDSPRAARSISERGLWFIYKHEALARVTNRLHWPKGASGVTLGAGYDMKERTAASINSDMLQLGLSADVASQIARGAKLTNDAANQFAIENHDLVNLSAEQQVALLRNTIGQYENIVRNSITVPLQQNQFDALVSFAYNPAGRWRSVSQLINSGSISAASNKIKEGNTSNGVAMKGLTNRRADEVNLLENARYEFNGVPIREGSQ